MSNTEAWLLGALVGFLAGGVLPAWMEYRRALCNPRIEITIDQKLVREIDERIVLAWLDARDLMWMPKGIDIKPKVKR
jgi:hypothetical protein